jgi:hypothetical protein
MAKEGQTRYSHLFTVRLWNEPLGQGQTEVRGEVKHLPSGAVRYFRTWAVLEAFFGQQLAESQDQGGDHEISE